MPKKSKKVKGPTGPHDSNLHFRALNNIISGGALTPETEAYLRGPVRKP